MVTHGGLTIGRYVLYVGCGIIFFFLLAPIATIIPLSFNSVPFFSYPMQGFSFRWYGELFGSELWQTALRNSLVVGFFSTIAATFLGTMSALGLYASRSKYAGAILGILLTPLLFPIVVTSVGLFYFFSHIGLTNSLLGIVIAHTILGLPFVVITVSGTLSRVDRRLMMAAQSLGAGPVRIFVKVVLPLILPGVISGGLFAFITSWDEVVAVIFLAGPQQHTLPRQMWNGTRDFLSPTVLASATVLTTVSCVLLLINELLRRRSERSRNTQGSRA